MKTMKIGIILLSFMLAAMIMAPMVSAGDQSDSPVMENTLVNQNISKRGFRKTPIVLYLSTDNGMHGKSSRFCITGAV